MPVHEHVWNFTRAEGGDEMQGHVLNLPPAKGQGVLCLTPARFPSSRRKAQMRLIVPLHLIGTIADVRFWVLMAKPAFVFERSGARTAHGGR